MPKQRKKKRKKKDNRNIQAGSKRGIRAINLESALCYLAQELLALLLGQRLAGPGTLLSFGARLSGAPGSSQGHQPAMGKGC